MDRRVRLIVMATLLSFCLTLLLLMVNACTPSPHSDPDISYLTGIPCTYPCWQGITPGITDEVSVISILTNPDLVVQDSLRMGRDKAITWFHYHRTTGGTGSVLLKDGIVYRIDINPEFHLTLADLINAGITPDFVRVQMDSSQVACYGAALYDVDNGVWIKTGKCNEKSASGQGFITLDGEISAEMRVTGLTFIQPDKEFESFLRKSLQLSPQTMEKIITNAHVWVGYDYYRGQ